MEGQVLKHGRLDNIDMFVLSPLSFYQMPIMIILTEVLQENDKLSWNFLQSQGSKGRKMYLIPWEAETY